MEKRMYTLVMYNISPIQAGIQAAHSIVEYGRKFGTDEDYIEWSEKWKTMILLNGGTSNSGKESYYDYPEFKGSMEKHLEALQNMGIKVAPFYEPDLNYSLTAISFIVDERVFDRSKYYWSDERIINWEELVEVETIDALTDKIKLWNTTFSRDGLISFVNSIGEVNFYLRTFLKQFKLATN